MDNSKDEFNRLSEKPKTLKNSIEEEIDKINKLYDKIFGEITKSFERRHEKLIIQENELKEELQNKVTQTKEKLENFLSESNRIINIGEKINKGINKLEKETEKNMIKILSYISKINNNKNETNDLLSKLMKNLNLSFQEEETNIKYQEYYFNGIQIPKDIQITDVKMKNAKIVWDIDDINNINIDKNKFKYRLEMKKGETNENEKRRNE